MASKDPNAVALGKRGASKGGLARAAKLSAEHLAEIGRRGAAARWGKGLAGEGLMGDTRVTVKVCAPANPKQYRTYRDVLVDTGATDSFFPRDVEKKGIRLDQKERARISSGVIIEYDAGDAILVVKGRRAPVLIGEAAPGSPLRLGVVALEVLGFKVNPVTRKLEPATKLA